MAYQCNGAGFLGSMAERTDSLVSKQRIQCPSVFYYSDVVLAKGRCPLMISKHLVIHTMGDSATPVLINLGQGIGYR